MDAKTLVFVQEVSARTWFNAERCLDEYIYFDIHKIFFAEFPILLHGWLVGLVSRWTNYQKREITEWSDQLIQKVTSVSKSISRAVDFCVDSILQGYMTKFAIDTITSYSEVE